MESGDRRGAIVVKANAGPSAALPSAQDDKLFRATQREQVSADGMVTRRKLLVLQAAMLAAVLTGAGLAQSGRNRAAPQNSNSNSKMSAADAATLSKSLTAYDNGDEAAARPDLERLATKYPGNFPANEALGILYMDAGDFAHAVPCLDHAVRSDATNAAAEANLGAAYLQTGNGKAAVHALRRSVALDAKNAKTFSSLGHALYLDKQPLEAAKAFSKAAALDPANTDDAYNWSVALYDAHNDAQAIDVLRRIPEAQRGEAVEGLWGDAEERRGQYKEAVAHLQRAAALNPNEANTYAVAVELLRHWSWEPAMAITQFGVQKFPESRRLQVANGIAYFGAGKYIEAAAIFGTLLARDPTNESFGSLLGRSCAATGGAASPQCDSLVEFAEKHPGNAQTDVWAAVSLLHQPSAEQHLDQVQHLLEEAIARDPKLPEAFYELGVLQQQRFAWAASAVSLKRAIELRPKFAEAHYRLSRAYSHTGEPELARREIALQQQYSQQEKDESNASLKEVTIFLTASH
jgi:tetratricopeptide (TPR) repeat protein